MEMASRRAGRGPRDALGSAGVFAGSEPTCARAHDAASPRARSSPPAPRGTGSAILAQLLEARELSADAAASVDDLSAGLRLHAIAEATLVALDVRFPDVDFHDSTGPVRVLGRKVGEYSSRRVRASSGRSPEGPPRRARGRGADPTGGSEDDLPSAEDVVEMDDPLEAATGIQDGQRCDRSGLHELERVRRGGARLDRLRRASHVERDRVLENGRSALAMGEEEAADVAVGDDAAERAVIIDHERHTEIVARRHLLERAAERLVRTNHRKELSRPAEIADAVAQTLAEASSRMEARVIVRREAALLEKRHGQRVADREGDG